MSLEQETGTAEAAPNNGNVSLVIQHTVRAGAVDRYENWLREIVGKAATYAGHQGVHIIRPTPGSTTYTIVLRFATYDDASHWARSGDRQALIQEIADALERDEELEIKPGIDFWFTPPTLVPKKARPWKQWLVTTSVIWPLTMLVPATLAPLFHTVPALGAYGVSHLIVASVIVALVTWVVMPRYVKLVSRWLFH